MRRTSLKFKAKPKWSSIVGLVLAGLGMLAISYYLLYITLQHTYPELVGILLAAFFGILGLTSLYILLRLETIVIEKDVLILYSLLTPPKKIPIKDIVGYSEIQKENKYQQEWQVLTLFTQSGTYKISSSKYDEYDYTQLKNILTKGKPRDVESEKKHDKKLTQKWALTFIVLGSLFLLGLGKQFHYKTQPLLEHQCTTLQATVAESPIIAFGKSSKSILIRFVEYPVFNFKLSGSGLYAANAYGFVSSVKAGDTLQIQILKEEYEKKIMTIKPLSLWDKTVNYRFISVYGLRDMQRSYLTLSDYNQACHADAVSWGFWFFIVIGVGVTVLGILMLRGYSTTG